MRIQHNIMAMNSYRNYNNNVNSLSANLEKLSSGYRINRAGDDAAGLAISEKMRAQITGLDAAQKNVKDGISLVKTAEGALQEVQDMMNRMVYLATQSANGTYDDSIDRANLQKEVDSLLEEIDRIADSANFNGQELLNGDIFDGKTNTLAVNTAALAATATKGGAADVDVKVVAENAYKTDGTMVTPTFKFATAAKAGVAVTASGAATISLVKGTEYTAAEIQELLKGATTAATGADAEAVLKAVQGATVAGAGVQNNAKADGTTLAWESVSTTAFTASGSGSSLTLQIGDTSDTFNQLKVSVRDMHADALGIADVDVSTLSGAQKAIDKIKAAINSVSSQRGDLGAIQNRLEHTMNNLSVMEENITDAESTIRDTDVADEMMAYTKNNILIQSAQAMLAQANAVPQGVLQLLQ